MSDDDLNTFELYTLFVIWVLWDPKGRAFLFDKIFNRSKRIKIPKLKRVDFK